MAAERPIDDEMIELADELEAAGLVTTGVDAEGNETWSLTPVGKQVANQMAMSAEDDAAGMLNALPDAKATKDWFATSAASTATMPQSCRRWRQGRWQRAHKNENCRYSVVLHGLAMVSSAASRETSNVEHRASPTCTACTGA